MKEQIEYCCKKLRLGRKIVDVFEEVEADNNQEYLMKILQIALDNRETSRKNRLVKQAGFYAMKTFEDFSFEEIRLPQDLSPEELKKASFVDEKKNLILYGNVGTGKTHLAQAIGLEACKQNKVVRFFRTAALVNRLSEAQKKSELNAFMKTLMKADLVICDEWGYVPLDRDGSKLLFQVISECYEQRSVIITTNLEFSKWVHIFYDEQMTSAMIDRLVHHSHLLLFEGQSFRIRNSLMKTH
ncbi:IS21-like element helper ATPase IstB [Mesotoga sp. TolDC]|jgi:DNA replication protein DnaC|uniref:IS21-like element helper ATPase IstB n=1 Tax=Mesotoga sp. TolDC TaxID=1389250 RepID=UPI000DA6C844|nr:IS21-like element helper ATPase IstB [Mesotoga sp. TolDC]PZC52775.1 ATP-binding protein [Mesotoga sp. TolDC]